MAEPNPAKKAKKEPKEKSDGEKIKTVVEVVEVVEAIADQLLKLREHVLASTLRHEHFPAMPDFATLAAVRSGNPANAIHQYFKGLNTDAGALQFLDNNERLYPFGVARTWKNAVKGPLRACPEAVDAMLKEQPALALYLLITANCAGPILYSDVSRAIIGAMIRPELGLHQRTRAMAQLILLERTCMLNSHTYLQRSSLSQTDMEAARHICVALIAFLTDGEFCPTGGLVEIRTSVHAYHMLCMRPIARQARDADLFNHRILNDLLIKKDKKAAEDKKGEGEDEDDRRSVRLHVEGVCTDCTDCVSPLDYNVELMNALILKAKNLY